MRIIPAIDIIDGKCVRLSQGDYDTQKIYNEDPLEVALEFQDHGIKYLHLVDLDGAKAGKIINHKVLEKLANRTDLQIDFGGGIRTSDDVRIALESGAKQITGGSIAVKNRDLFLSWLQQYGANRIILGADARDRKIAVSGWLDATEEKLSDFVRAYQQQGVQYVISTDIAKDGMLQGPAFDLYKELMEEVPQIKLIASGGVSTMKDLEQLAEAGLEGAIVGKAIYEGHITLKELSKLC